MPTFNYMLLLILMCFIYSTADRDINELSVDSWATII